MIQSKRPLIFLILLPFKQVNLLKHGIPDPSSTTLSHPQSSDKEAANKPLVESGDEYMAAPIFVHTRVRDHDNTPQNSQALQKALAQCFGTSRSVSEGQDAARGAQDKKLFLVPAKGKDGSSRPLYESYASALWKVRDQVSSPSLPLSHSVCICVKMWDCLWP